MRVIGTVEIMASKTILIIKKNITDGLGFNINPIALLQPV
jgi:hypothetical protein